MELLWLAIFAILLIGYFALEGFTIGVGLTLPWRPKAERGEHITAIAPFVLAGEVWLVGLAGVLFGAFPRLEEPVITENHTVVVLLVLSWVLRDAGLWFRARADWIVWRRGCETLLTVGSVGLALSWGTLVSALIHGSVTALAVLYAGIIMALFALHGMRFAAWRLRGGKAGALAVSAIAAAVPAIVLIAGFAGTLLDNTADGGALTAMAWILGPIIPVMAFAQWWVWRTFSKPSDIPSFF
ncbi:cytochrome d ubiquinol oxidase subunit II [Rhizohabitans arisaemae]|uniref:cytochrome d ubiquinol oxidase subunit II n=1 Tax=Rhizohabitans arisaemae TaxID=2720610 RepID=UPI0024B08923|nr:cytochrome d ubiquinol oxidase subunit II [Rhizohabitans arisaemae]